MKEARKTPEQKGCSYDIVVPEMIKKLRVERELSMSMLGEIAGLVQSCKSRVESGENKIGFTSAEKIAGTLKVGLDWILYRNEDKKHYPANDRLVDWLWLHVDVRKSLWERIENEKCEDKQG